MKSLLLICFIVLNNAFSADPVRGAYFNKYGSDSEVEERLGKIGDYYVDTETNMVYGPKKSNTDW